MGKRSDFVRRERDTYFTPEAAVLPLLPHLDPGTRFVEPCAGDGRLVRHLEKHGHVCVGAFDVEPQHPSVRQGDALAVQGTSADMCITNTPWDRKFLHPFIEHWLDICPMWLLFDADWMHTVQSGPFMRYCHMVVSVGRVRWIEDSKMTGKDNCAWYRFEATQGETVFIGR